MLRALREIMDRPGHRADADRRQHRQGLHGDFGPPYRRSYRVFGDAINTAARVMSRAEPGRSFRPRSCWTARARRSRPTPIEPFGAKGKAEPVRASVVGPVVGTEEHARRRDRRSSGGTPSSTRCSTWSTTVAAARLDRRDRRRAGVGQVAARGGADRARRADIVVLHARCEEYEASTPYFALREPMRDGRSGSIRRRTPTRSSAPARGRSQRVDPSPRAVDAPARRSCSASTCRHARDRAPRRALPARARSRTSRCDFSSRVSRARRRCSSSRTSTSWTRRAPTCCRGSRGRAPSLRQVLLVTHSRPGTTLGARPTTGPALPVVRLCRCRRRMAEIVRARHRGRPLVTPRCRGDRPPLRRERAVPLRAARHRAGDGSVEALPDSVESLIAGDIDRLSPTDGRCFATPRSSVRASTRAALGAVRERGRARRRRVVAARELVDPETRRGSCASATRSSGTRPTRGSRSAAAVCCTSVSARRSSARGHSRRGGGLGPSRCISSRRGVNDKAWTVLPAGRRSGEEDLRQRRTLRFYERARPPAAGCAALRRRPSAAVYEALGDVRYLLGEHRRADDAFKSARRLPAAAPPTWAASR